MHRRHGRPRWIAALAAGIVAMFSAGCDEALPEHHVIPVPVSIDVSPAGTLVLDDAVQIVVDGGDAEARRIGLMLSELLGNTVETMPPVVDATADVPRGGIRFTRLDTPAALGAEGYELEVTAAGVVVRAPEAAGLFYGMQTLRMLLPPAVEYAAAFPSPMSLPLARVTDGPRFGWRGAMLDVARHFLPPSDVKRFIDLMALYKLNRLHLHLSDDQGWRIEIPEWPDLTAHGGSTEVGGRAASFYTVEEYAELVRYAEDRFITVVPEIDVPGHTNAALASYPELNCDGIARELYTGTEVGFSSLCPDSETTFAFLDDVVAEISRHTSGAWFHVGGDEVEELTPEEYTHFIERAQDIVQSHGKHMVGWDEIASAELEAGSVVQLWRPLWPASGSEQPDSARAARAAELQAGVLRAVNAGATVLLSPADRVYLDMKYDSSTVLGLTWAGLADVRTSYDWSVGDLFAAVPEESIAGIEAPLWSETVRSLADFEYMAFPRLAGVAELAWSAEAGRSWEDYRARLGAQAPRWAALGVNFHRAPQIEWVEGS